MDGFQFISSMFQSIVSLAWPAAFVGAVWLFREKLVELLPRLIVRHKDWEAGFRLDSAENEAKSLPPLPTGAEVEPTPEESTRFEQIAKLSPKAAILEVRRDLDQAVRGFAAKYGAEVRPTTTQAGAIRALRSRGAIDEHTSAMLDDLRNIGNAAAHSPDAHFTLNDALRYKRLADRIIGNISRTE